MTTPVHESGPKPGQPLGIIADWRSKVVFVTGMPRSWCRTRRGSAAMRPPCGSGLLARQPSLRRIVRCRSVLVNAHSIVSDGELTAEEHAEPGLKEF